MSSRLHSPLTACRQPKKNLSCFQWFFSSLKYEYRWKNERPWMFLDFRQNNNNAGSHRGADARSRGVGNTIISPTLHIPSLTFPSLFYHNRTHWLEIIPILVNFSFVPLAISRLSSQKKVRCLIIPDWTLPSAHSAILQLPENWQLATNHKDIINANIWQNCWRQGEKIPPSLWCQVS